MSSLSLKSSPESITSFTVPVSFSIPSSLNSTTPSLRSPAPSASLPMASDTSPVFDTSVETPSKSLTAPEASDLAPVLNLLLLDVTFFEFFVIVFSFLISLSAALSSFLIV